VARSILREVVQEIAAKHVPQALEGRHRSSFRGRAAAVPAQANPITINEIFANLIDTAIRYNEPGGSVVIRLFDEKGRHVVDVEDDGPGIPDAEREKVFTRFYRLSRDQSRVGSGLGLAIVRSLGRDPECRDQNERRKPTTGAYASASHSSEAAIGHLEGPCPKDSI